MEDRLKIIIQKDGQTVFIEGDGKLVKSLWTTVDELDYMIQGKHINMDLYRVVDNSNWYQKFKDNLHTHWASKLAADAFEKHKKEVD
jgi:hypothetical protein